MHVYFQSNPCLNKCTQLASNVLAEVHVYIMLVESSLSFSLNINYTWWIQILWDMISQTAIIHYLIEFWYLQLNHPYTGIHKCPSLNYMKVIWETSFRHILKMVATIIWLKSCQYGIKIQIINQSIYIFNQKRALVSILLIIINCNPLTDQKIGWRSKEMPKPWVLLVDVLKSDFLSPVLLDQLEKQPP